MILETERHFVPAHPTVSRRKGLKPTFKGLLLWHVLAVFWIFTNSLCSCQSASGQDLIDLSHVFDNTTIYWVTAQPLTINVTYNGIVDGGIWYQAEKFSAGTHGGTHMDAPCHFAKGRWCVDDIPLNNLIVPAVVVDISGEVNGDPTVHLTIDHLATWEKKHGKIPEKCLLLVYTGWSQYWPDRLNYTGTLERDASLLSFPSITPDSAQWLVDSRDIVGVGIDTMSLDSPEASVSETHAIFFEKNIYGLENVNNLEKLPPTGSTAYVLPMKLKDASGAPCRVLASVPSGQTSGAPSGLLSFHFLFFIILVYTIFAS